MLRKKQLLNEDAAPAAEEAPSEAVNAGGYSGPDRRKAPRYAALDTPGSAEALQAEFDKWSNDSARESVQPAPAPPPGPPPQSNSRLGLDSIQSDLRWTVSQGPRESIFSGVGGRVKMGPARIFLLMIALAAGGMAAFLVTQRETPVAPVAPEPEIVQEARTQILVAKRTINVGERLTPDVVDWKDWPEASVEAGYVDIAQSPDAISGMTGTMARYEIFAGEPVREEKLVRSAQGYLPAILEDGVRAVSVTVSAGAASGGFIGPNDHVDVVLTHPPSHDEMSSGKLLANTILFNVQVLALNGQLGRTPREDDPDKPDNGNFSGEAMATLALDPDQAKVIIHAASVGKLSLVLRSISDFSEEQKAEQAGANAAIRISSPFWNG